MEVSLLLMEQIAQLFIVLLMGYIVVKAKLLKPSDSMPTVIPPFSPQLLLRLVAFVSYLLNV